MQTANPKLETCPQLILSLDADGIIICDRNLHILFPDKRTIDLLGRKKHQLVGKHITSIFKTDINYLHRTLRPGKTIRIQDLRVTAKTPETEYRVDIWIKRFPEGNNGEHLMYFKKKLWSGDPNWVIQHIREAIFVCDANMELVFMNESMRKLFRYNSISQKPLLTTKALFAGEHDQTALPQILTKHARSEGRVLFKRKDGSNFWGRLDWYPDERNGQTFFCGIITDLTDIVTCEDRLNEKTNMLYRINEQLDTFIYRASHDLRAPLTTMEGIIHLHRLENRNDNPYLEMLADSLDKLKNFVGQLTSFSRNMHQKVNDERLDFDQMISGIFTDLGAHDHFRFPDREVLLHTNSPFFSDAFRIKLILRNILENAFDFCDLRKTRPQITISIVTSADKAVIQVFDNGRGIPKAYVEKVFDMFFRADNDAKGSGIGLYITKETVRSLKGTIAIKSEFGIGTSVSIEIPNSDKGRLIALMDLRRRKQMKYAGPRH